MKKLLSNVWVVLMVSIFVGCDEFVVIFSNNAPIARTCDVLINGTSAEFGGSFSGDVDWDESVFCFELYDDFERIHVEYVDGLTYLVDSRDNDYGDRDISFVFYGLKPNKQYRYRFGVLHGELTSSGEFAPIGEGEEVWGEDVAFETGKVVPKINRVRINDYGYSYHKDTKSEVLYNVTVELDSSIDGYVDPDCIEYGFYAIADDGSFSKYISGVRVSEDGTELDLSIVFNKQDYSISRTNSYCHAITSSCKIGLYMMNENQERKTFAEKSYAGFEYTLQPKIRITELEQGEIEKGDFSDGEHEWDRRANYEYELEYTGALFFDSVCQYNYGSWVTPGRDADRSWYGDGKTGTLDRYVRYDSSNSSHTNYIYCVADIGGFEITSVNSIKLYFDGNGDVDITISYYVPSTSTSASATDLNSYGETANCYIISKTGTYKFKPVKGNSSISVGSVSSVEVLWESFGTSTKPSKGDLIKSVRYESGAIVFSTADYFREGNAVIAAKDYSGKILWSWHIWLTDQPQGQVYYNNAGTMMDRNLGATSATPGDVGALGLLYQWGRKDPFLSSSSISSSVEAKSTATWPSAVTSSSSTGNVEYATANPMTFIGGVGSSDYDWHYSSRNNYLWKSDKTVYDPCPPGWRVPDGASNGVWATACGSYSRFDYSYDSIDEGMNFSGTFGSSSIIWYPASGHLSSFGEGALSGVGYNGCYWSTAGFTYAFYGSISSSGYYDSSEIGDRAYGHSVRCLKE